jgi:hypothetical protein
MYKEAVAAYFKELPGICLTGLGKTTQNLSQDSRSPDRTWDVPNKKQDCYTLD